MDFPPGPNFIVPTAPSGDSSNRSASTAFVTSAISANQAFPSGTVLLFYQAAAPTGWTQVVTSNDVGLRVVNTAGGGTGGSTVFSTVFGQSATGAHTLTTSEISGHAHSVGIGTAADGGSVEAAGTSTTNTSFTSGSAGGGGSHTHPISLQLSYIDIILASKN